MNTEQLEYEATGSGRTQNERTLHYLQENAGSWVSMLVLERASGSRRMNSRIADLRRDGHAIEHRNEWQTLPDGRRICRSFYRLSPPITTAPAA